MEEKESEQYSVLLNVNTASFHGYHRIHERTILLLFIREKKRELLEVLGQYNIEKDGVTSTHIQSGAARL